MQNSWLFSWNPLRFWGAKKAKFYLYHEPVNKVLLWLMDKSKKKWCTLWNVTLIFYWNLPLSCLFASPQNNMYQVEYRIRWRSTNANNRMTRQNRRRPHQFLSTHSHSLLCPFLSAHIFFSLSPRFLPQVHHSFFKPLP